VKRSRSRTRDLFISCEDYLGRMDREIGRERTIDQYSSSISKRRDSRHSRSCRIEESRSRSISARWDFTRENAPLSLSLSLSLSYSLRVSSGVGFDFVARRQETKTAEVRVSVKRRQSYHHQYVSRSYVLDTRNTIHARTHTGRCLLHSALIISRRLPFWRGRSDTQRCCTFLISSCDRAVGPPNDPGRS